MIDAADNASRRAHQLGQEGRRLPRPGEIDRLPGTGDRGGDGYTYTVVVTMTSKQTGQQSTFTLVVRDPRILPADQVIAAAQQMVAQGQITQRMGSGPPALRRAVVQDMQVISVYRGNPEIR